MNEQDTAAADTLLLLEVEEKVKMRMVQVVNDVVWGFEGATTPTNYTSAVISANSRLRKVIKTEIHIALTNARSTPTI